MDLPKIRFIFNGPIYSTLIGIYYYFLLNALVDLFYIANNIQIAIVAITLSFINLFSFLIEHFKSNFFTRILMEFSEIVKWASLILFFIVLPIYIIQWYLFPLPKLIISLLLSIILALFLYSYYKAHNIKINDITLELDNLDENIDILQFSDVHYGSIRNKKLLKSILNKLNSIKPDLAIISGDLVDGSSPVYENSLNILKSSKSPILFTPGNHDFFQGIDNVITACENANIIVLDNNFIDFKGIRIFGLSFGSDLLQFNSKKNKINILINHIPVKWDKFSKLGFNIQLSGHTHGGQFYPANLWVKTIFPYLKGLYKKENNYLIVSTGVGTMGPPLRWGTDAEMILLKLRKK